MFFISVQAYLTKLEFKLRFTELRHGTRSIDFRSNLFIQAELNTKFLLLNFLLLLKSRTFFTVEEYQLTGK